MRNMQKISLLLTFAVLNAPSAFAADKAPTSDIDKLSYSLGVKTAENFQSQDIQINPAQFAQGLTDQMQKKQPALSDQEMQDTISAFQEKHITAMIEKEKKAAVANLAEGEKFMKTNAQKPSVKTTNSGLQYEVLSTGKGTSPKNGDNVIVNYRGTLLDGTEFDSSYRNKQAATLPLDRLIPGWQEALKMMQPGAKWKIYVPPQLAYGEQGAGNVIGPNSTLIFEIELVDVEPAS